MDISRRRFCEVSLNGPIADCNRLGLMAANETAIQENHTLGMNDDIYRKKS